MALTQLRKFSTTVYKDSGTSDIRQVPAVGAQVTVYRQGATVSDLVFVSSITPTTVPVYHYGRLAVGNVVQLGINSGQTFTVEELTNETHIKLRAVGGTIVVGPGQRLVLQVNPTLYSDSSGTASQSNPAFTDDKGLVEFYTQDWQVDIIYSGDGVITKLLEDEGAGYPPGRDYYDVNEFASVQAALDFLPPRYYKGIKRLYFPSAKGPYTPPSAAGWLITKPVEIFGDGDITAENQGFMPFVSGGTTKNSVIFTIQKFVDPFGVQPDTAPQRIYFHDCVFSGPVQTQYDGTGDYLRIDQVNNVYIPSSIRIERCAFLYAGRSAIRSLYTPNDDTTGQYLVELAIDHCQIYGCAGEGMVLAWVTGLSIDGLGVLNCRKSGIFLEQCGQMDIRCEIGNCALTSTDGEKEGYLVLKQAADTLIHNCNFEGFAYWLGGPWADNPPSYTGTPVKNGLVLNACRGVTVVSNEFDNGQVAATLGSKGLYLTNDATGADTATHKDKYHKSYGNYIGQNLFAFVDHAVELSNSVYNYGNTIGVQGVQEGDANGSCQIIVPVSTRSIWFPHGSVAGAPIWKTSHAAGITLPSVPGVTDIEPTAIQNGMIVFDSTNSRYYFRIGGVWKYIDAADMH